MNQLEGLLVLVALPLCLLLSGYWLSCLLTERSALERLALALPGGLGVLLALLAWVNFFLPLAGFAAYGCLAPALLTVLLPRSRTSLWRDLRAAWAAGSRRLVLSVAALFFILLLWPVLQTPSGLFYDGTSNHDSFFWISGAEHLKRHPYMEAPVVSATQPMTNNATAFTGLNPPWGRMGAEGLLAVASSVVGVSPLKLYLYGTASLAVTWFAVVYLAYLTFVSGTISRLTAAALVSLQPIFVFFYGNSNLPNLIGILTGGTVVIAVARAAGCGSLSRRELVAWTAVGTLSLHGLLCSYPEMVPFILLPCGLLWLRPWLTRGPRAYGRTALIIAATLLAGFALNPATTIRACNGFMASYVTARADNNWANLFNPLILAEYLPALVSLSVSGAKELGHWLGWPLSLLIVLLAGCIFRRSRDRYGLLVSLAGGGVLLAYTIITGFAYGWQKTVQFSGIFVALLFPVAGFEMLSALYGEASGRMKRVLGACFAGIALFLAFATIMSCRDIYKWSDRKVLSADWFALREQSYNALKGAPVLVEAGSFRMAFFHGMWAAYFLPESRIYFGSRGEESGGYLRNGVINEAQQEIPPPQAVLVGRPWADTLDANSPRILTGREFTLLQKSNRVFVMSGVQPLNGPPDQATRTIRFEILPHSDGNLLLDLAPRQPGDWTTAKWVITRQTEGKETFTVAVSGPPPWMLAIPLIARQRNQVAIVLEGTETPANAPAFAIKRIRIEDRP